MTPVFDPRQVPVIAVDTNLPKVPLADLRVPAVRARFSNPPAWTPELIAESRFSDRAPMAASVLIPLVMRDQLTVLLTQRTPHLSSHSGQIAFPGGKRDPEDIDDAATALREAHEEIGLEPEQIEILGSLPIYTTGSAFHVTPVIALVQPGHTITANAYEVDAVFEVPLAFLMDPANHRHHEVEFAGAKRRWLSIPYQDGGTERFIWGATAGMLRNLYRFLMA